MANHLTGVTPEREGLVRAAHKESADLSADSGTDAHPVLTLQRQVGNAQIQRLLAQRQAPEEEELQAKRDPSAVQREESPEEEIQEKRDPAVQREAEEDELQMKRNEPEVGLEGGPVSSQVEGQIDSMRGSGAPLEHGTRSTMEGSFGEAFDDVRVHQGGEADSLNRSLGARAFTTGSDIFFRQDASPSDHALLGHELTHVVQQRDGSVGGGGGMHVGPANDSFEQAADSAGSAVGSGGAVAQPKREHE